MSKPLNPWKITGYKAGQNVVCKVSYSEPGGYAVIIPKDNLPGFLPTEAQLRPGEEVLAQFVCVSNNRILLQCRFGTNTTSGASRQKVDWNEQLNQIDSSQQVDWNEQLNQIDSSQQVDWNEQLNQIESSQQQPGQTDNSHSQADQPYYHSQDAQSDSKQFEVQGQFQGEPLPFGYGTSAMNADGLPAQKLSPDSEQFSQAPAKSFDYRSDSHAESPAYAHEQTQIPAPPAVSSPLPTNSDGSVLPITSSATKASTDDWVYSGQGMSLGSNSENIDSAAPRELSAAEADAAFQAWAPKAPIRKFQLKRATDLVPPPCDSGNEAHFTSEEQDLEWLITDIEGGMRTGCVKAICQSRLSRSAVLLFKGRAVGCIYGRKGQTENYGTEQSLQIMMQDLEQPDTQIQLYDLPENVILPMSALFLGYPVPREAGVDARSYVDYMCNWFATKSQTACLAITLPSRLSTCLCFIYEGNSSGSFFVEEQRFAAEKEFAYDLMKNDSAAIVEASILPPEMTSSAVRFGFNLSMSRKRAF
jgi:hypothetical protein